MEDEGAAVAGPVSSVAGALTLVSVLADELDVAIQDINLRGMVVYRVAEKLAQHRIPFIFVTGYVCDSLLESFKTTPCLNRPLQ
ncbi:hypothetical protein [Rhizobium hidalgonense]|uniref:hypothetical protein n=1 Tax=Rhizobium hidalgonense TaxID=1538159 RepID=UPI002870D9A2|nr:hypothetical protein [Rhizobium hidalgonense]MDR9805711.1 hypothetical protein [Rhizobium hidalgonense]